MGGRHGFTGSGGASTLLAQGGWDEDFLNDQDTELAARLRAAGGRVVCVQDMAAAYIPRNSLRALSRQYARYGRYRVKTSRRTRRACAARSCCRRRWP